MSGFQRIGIVGRLDAEQSIETAARLVDFLRQRDIEPMFEEEVADRLPNHLNGTIVDRLRAECDLVMVIGGDGSMLHAARKFTDAGVPLLGINRGRLGFLTDILPDDLEARVTEVLEGRYVITRRFMLDCRIMRGTERIGEAVALNDVVLQPMDSIRMIEFELYIDDQYVYTLRSDGLIVATPTGSTAYALSGGGPILHPNLNAIDLVPINPHRLSNRPIVVGGDSKLEVRVNPDNTIFPWVVCDGQVSIEAAPGDVIHIKRHEGEIQLLHPVEHDFYETCRSKLNWASE